MTLSIDRAELQRSFPYASPRVIRTIESLFSGVDQVMANPNADIAAAASTAQAMASQGQAAAELASVQATDATNVASAALTTSLQALQSASVAYEAPADQVLPLAMDTASKMEKIYLTDGSINTDVSYRVLGTKVVGVREAGWTAFSGAVVANKGAYAPANAYTTSALYVQAEAAAVAAALVAANARIRALEDALRTHGLIT